MIYTRSLGQTRMDATRFLHLHREEFSCLLASLALLQSKPGSLGPNLRPTLQALSHIPNPGLVGSTERKSPLGFTIYPAIHQKGFIGPPRQHNPGFTVTHILAHGSLGQWFYHDPQSDSGTTRPCALSFEYSPNSTSNPSRNPAQLEHANPTTPWMSRNGKARLKTVLHLAKPMPQQKKYHMQ